MSLTEFIIFCFAAWRIASLLVRERGPFNLFAKIRELTGIRHDEEGVPYLYPENVFAQVLECVWCTSLWVAFGWVVLWLLFPYPVFVIATAFAISAGAILLDNLLDN